MSLSSLACGKFLSLCTCRAHLCALLTRKSCAVGMQNAILRKHLKEEIPLLYNSLRTFIYAKIFNALLFFSRHLRFHLQQGEIYGKNISSSHAVKILFLSFTFEDIGVAIVTKTITIAMVT